MLDYITIGYDLQASPRVLLGIRLLREGLKNCGYIVHEKPGAWSWDHYRTTGGRKLYIGNRQTSPLLSELEERDVLLYHTEEPGEEGFYLATLPGRLQVVSGGDDNGVLYGCQELAGMIREAGALPLDLACGDYPRFRWRGTAVGLQNSQLEAPRQAYEYPLTPERFPWFYDKAMWLDYLDRLFEHRANVLFLWNGHPFSSLVRLPDYPEALEVTPEQYQLNRKILMWLIEETDRRGIRLFLSFYNIHVPHALADKYGLAYSQTRPVPVTSDYYRKSLAAFVRDFPQVGLMVCLGEKLKGQMYGAEWLCETILPGIKQGLDGQPLPAPPPVIVRSHGINVEQVMEEADPLYPNLHTEMKYNGESLTTWTPRGEVQKLHQRLGSRRGIHMANVHMLTNLEPFRWGAPSFIQKCVQAAKYRLNANALHFYPLSFWGWPYSPDQTEPRLRQVDRDWLWYAAWLRYAWNPDRDYRAEKEHWVRQLGERHGSPEAAHALLEALEAAGQCAPKLLRRFGITQGNRQTMSLGMTMSQLTNPDRYTPWSALWESHAPQGERLEDYVLKELAGMPHVGETPLDVVDDVERLAGEAERAVKRARTAASKNKAEVDRLVSDIEAIRALVCSYTYKVRGALLILMYKHTSAGRYSEAEPLEEAVEWIEKSLTSYRRLTALTEKQYRYANGMQTPQRKIPFRDGLAYSHWRNCLPLFEEELDNLRQHIAELKAGVAPAALHLEASSGQFKPFEGEEFRLLTESAEVYRIEKGARVFTDGDIPIIGCAEELYGLNGIRFSQLEAVHGEVSVEIELDAPAKVLIGYFHSPESQWLQPVESGKGAAEPSASGSHFPVIRKGIRLFSYPSVDIHAVSYAAGRHTLCFGKGAYLIIGVVKATQPMTPREYDPNKDDRTTLDWLYEKAREVTVL